MRTRQRVLAGLLVVAALLTTLLLWRVLTTVFFAVTIAYVLYPVRRRLRERGLGRRVTAALSTSVAFLAVALLVVPPMWSLYRRQDALLSFLRSLPATVEFDVYGTEVVFALRSLVAPVRTVLRDLAFDAVGIAPVLGLKLFLFTLLVYALLLRPSAASEAVFRLVPGEYHDLTRRLHVRIRDTLYAIYVLQGATALATFAVGYALFALLGYDGAFALAVAAGILQFVPIVGPSVLVVAVAATEVLAGEVQAAVTVTVLGLVFVGFLPDAIVRPQLSPYIAGIPGSLYFIGFTGGVLSIGLVGFIAGPLIIALFVEVVELIAAERGPTQQPLT